MLRGSILLVCAAAMLLCLSGCGGKGESKSTTKETAKQETAQGEHAKEEVTLSPEAIANAGIKTAPVKAEAVQETISVTANISHNQDRLFHVTPRIRGRVVEISVSVGSEVKAGSPLALLDSTELGEAKAEYTKAKTLLDLAKANLEREKRLFEQKISAEKDLLTAQAEARKAEAEVKVLREKLLLYGLSEQEIAKQDASPSRYQLTSPGPGVVVERDLTRGEVIEAGKQVFTVSDLSTVWVLLHIYERDLAKVRKETPVQIRTESSPGEVFAGTVAYVGDTVDPQSRTVAVRVEILNPGRRLKPGMFATAEIVTGTSASASIMLPSGAIQRIEGKPVLFVQQEDGAFAKREVELGKEVRGQVEVKSGLQEGELVVIEGVFTLKAEILKEGLAGHDH